MADGDFGETYTATFEAGTDLKFAEGTLRGTHEVKSDEPEWLPVGGGNDEHPSPVDYMVASLVFCQLSVLSQALEKARVEEFHVSADAEIDELGTDDVAEEMPENTANRVQHVSIDIDLEVPEEDESRARRCLEVYDTGCIVGQSFKNGVDYTPSTSLTLTD